MNLNEIGQKTKIEERQFKQLIRKYYNFIIVVILILVGVTLIAISLGNKVDWGNLSPDLYGKLGNAFIVGGISWGVLLSIKKSIERIFESRTDKIEEAYAFKARDKRLIDEVKETGIRHIYRDRGTSDESYITSLLENLDKIPENGEVKIIGVTLARFFGPNYNKELLTAIFRLLRRNVKFKLLMLDPRSKDAISRAYIDQSELVSKHGYVASTILNDSLAVIRRLKLPTSDWVIQPSLIDRIKNQIEVRLYDTNPVLHLIIMNKYSFVELYHNGGGDYIREALKRHEDYSNLPNYTGFVPVFQVNKFSLFGELMTSHFDNIWDSGYSKSHCINDTEVYEAVFDFKTNEWLKRNEMKD